jgi:hypothetical protein
VVSVRYRFDYESPYGSRLVVTDVNGARLGVSIWDSPAMRCVADAVGRGTRRRVKVSRSAFTMLNLDDGQPDRYARCRDRGIILRALLLGLLLVLLLAVAYALLFATEIRL